MQPLGTPTLLEKLRSSEKGLTSDEALRRLAETGPNEPAQRGTPAWPCSF